MQPSAGHAFALPPTFLLRPSALGQRLPEAVQQKMEAFFGTRFDDVRIHVGNEAPSIGALAFTHGTDLYFAPGQYNPQTPQGQQLLGHELTHVVQQRAGRVRNPLGPSVAVVQDPGLEAEAERMGLRAAQASIAARPGVAAVAAASGGIQARLAPGPAGSLGGPKRPAVRPGVLRPVPVPVPVPVGRMRALQARTVPPGPPAGGPGVTLTIHLPSRGAAVPRPRPEPGAARTPGARRAGIIQPAGIKIQICAEDESKAVVDRLIFTTRPPVDKAVEQEVASRNFNRKNLEDPVYEVGHIIGWDLINSFYQNMFRGRTIQSISDEMRLTGINCQPTIKTVAASLGIWVDKHYKENFSKNEFCQEKAPNMSSGGTVPHAKANYESDLAKKVLGKEAHKKLKQDFIGAEINKPEKMEMEEKEFQELVKFTWDGAYPASPLQPGDY